MTKQNKVKTNAMRLLDKHHVAYTTFTYPDTLHSAQEVAPVLGVPADHVFKTLVVLADEGRHLLIMVPGDRELDMRLVAQAVGAKHARMAPQHEAERLTGLKVGGISPLALLDRHFEIYVYQRGPARHKPAPACSRFACSYGGQSYSSYCGAARINYIRPRRHSAFINSRREKCKYLIPGTILKIAVCWLP